MTDRIRRFIEAENPKSPCLVIDIDIVRQNYRAFRAAMPTSDVYYAVKANPEPTILQALAELGSSFDCASVAEIEMALAAGATSDRISFGNTIKKAVDIARAHALGVSLFAVDSSAEVEKIATSAPGARVFCRILTNGKGAEWPLSRKFGCDTDMAVEVLRRAHALGLRAVGVSFHVGSQMLDPGAWDAAIADARRIFDVMAADGIELTLLNLGGGFPSRYLRGIPSCDVYGENIRSALNRHFGDELPMTIIEPGRGMVGNAGVILGEVVLVSRKSASDGHRWVFLDIGKFGGLAETMDEAIRYLITTDRDGDETEPCVLAGPTCDSADVLYEKEMYPLPLSLRDGDRVYIEAAGAYTTTYSAVAFNGFEPLRSYVVADGR